HSKSGFVAVKWDKKTREGVSYGINRQVCYA
ncbi:unnamed protein product, partial [marine sediment metagenome]